MPIVHRWCEGKGQLCPFPQSIGRGIFGVIEGKLVFPTGVHFHLAHIGGRRVFVGGGS